MIKYNRGGTYLAHSQHRFNPWHPVRSSDYCTEPGVSPTWVWPSPCTPPKKGPRVLPYTYQPRSQALATENGGRREALGSASGFNSAHQGQAWVSSMLAAELLPGPKGCIHLSPSAFLPQVPGQRGLGPCLLPEEEQWGAIGSQTRPLLTCPHGCPRAGWTFPAAELTRPGQGAAQPPEGRPL